MPGRDSGRLADIGAQPGGPPGQRVFVQSGCGSCHRLADAGTSGATGPALDDALAGESEAAIRRAIVAPDAEVAEGFEPGVMPSDYSSRLSAPELDALVEYLAATTR